MALIEKTLVDKVELVENNSIQVRTATIIERDGIEKRIDSYFFFTK